jgi:hypothetical protein
MATGEHREAKKPVGTHDRPLSRKQSRKALIHDSAMSA